MWHGGSSSPTRDENLGPLRWEHRVLATGPPVKSLGIFFELYIFYWSIADFKSDFSGGSVVKNPPAHTGDTGGTGSIPGSGRSPGGGNGNPLWDNPMDRGAWWATV